MQKAELKKRIDSLVDELPEDTNWDELMYKIYVRQSIEEGLQDSKEGKTTPDVEI
jgi:Tfp pilus assembly protein PilO